MSLNNSAITQSVGVPYQEFVTSSLGHTLVSNNTYFNDTSDNIPRYKDADGTIFDVIISSSYALTASHALNAGGGSTFPYTGSAIISGSLDVTGSLDITGSVGISLTSGSAFSIEEPDNDQQGRLDFSFTQGDPVLEIGSRTNVGYLNLRKGFTGDAFKIGSDGTFAVDGTTTIQLNASQFKPNATNTIDLGVTNRRFKDVFLYSGAKLGWSANTVADLVALKHIGGTNTLEITGSSPVDLDIKGNTRTTGSLVVSGSVNINSPENVRITGSKNLLFKTNQNGGYFELMGTNNVGMRMYANSAGGTYINNISFENTSVSDSFIKVRANSNIVTLAGVGGNTPRTVEINPTAAPINAVQYALGVKGYRGSGTFTDSIITDAGSDTSANFALTTRNKSGDNILRVRGDKVVEITGSIDVTGDVTASAFKGNGSALTNLKVGSNPARVVFTTTDGELTTESGFDYNSSTNQLTVDSINVVSFTSSFITSSTIESSGSHTFGDSTSDTQTLVGTILMSGSAQLTGSFNIDGNVETSTTGKFIGPLEGNADTSTKIASITNSNIVQLTSTQALTNKDLTGAGNTFPTFNQNTTGTAAGLSSTLVVGSGGTGLTALGTAGQVLSVNAGATALEYTTPTSGSLTGNGTATRVPFYDTATSFSTNSGFIYSTGIKQLRLTGDSTNAPLRLDNVLEDDSESLKALVLDGSNNVDFQNLGTNALSSTTIYTYDLNATQDGNNVDVNLTSTPGTDTSVVQLTAGPNITLDRVSATEVAISASAGSSGISDEARIFTWFSTMA